MKSIIQFIVLPGHLCKQLTIIDLFNDKYNLAQIHLSTLSIEQLILSMTSNLISFLMYMATPPPLLFCLVL